MCWLHVVWALHGKKHSMCFSIWQNAVDAVTLSTCMSVALLNINGWSCAMRWLISFRTWGWPGWRLLSMGKIKQQPLGGVDDDDDDDGDAAKQPLVDWNCSRNFRFANRKRHPQNSTNANFAWPMLVYWSKLDPVYQDHMIHHTMSGTLKKDITYTVQWIPG